MRTVARYSIAVITVAAALAPTVLLPDLLAPMRLFFLWCAVLISALVAGTGAGLLATALALGGAMLLIFAPVGALGAYDIIRLLLFGLFAGGISIAVGRTKTLARRLRESELRYRTLVEATPVAQAVWTAAPDGTTKSAPDWLGEMVAEDAARIRERWREAIEKEAMFEDEVRIRLPDGRQRWFAIKATPVRADGDHITEWVGIIADVHDRRRHEENAAFINRASEVLSAMLDARQMLRNFARLCVPALGESCVIELNDATRIAEPEDARHVDSMTTAPLIARGRILGTLSIANSDTALIEELARRAAMALDNARLYEAADAANRAKDDFLATLSHELRTPLTAISGWAHMLSTGISDPDMRQLAIDTIVRSAQTQGELIDDLLDLSRVVAGTLQLQVAPVDLAMVVHEVLVAARPAADAKKVTLELISASTPIVRGDERRLRQIVWNLVTNAVKFTDAGGHVLLTITSDGKVACVEVADTGRGIDPSFLPYVWDRFRQADSSTSRQHGGLGLGLSVVRHLVEMHGGTVQATSDGPGKGATFRIELPLSG